MGGGGVEQKFLFTTNCFPDFNKGWGQSVVPRFLLLVSDVYQGNEEAG